jgi:hypothetical protein
MNIEHRMMNIEHRTMNIEVCQALAYGFTQPEIIGLKKAVFVFVV